jgi:O-antigen/teichoic acid export membrane protein
MVNTGTTGALGILYWLLAARHYSAVDVGRASAAYSAMNLLSGFTAFNLVGAITRFVPQAGRRTPSLVLRAYAFSSIASLIVTTLVLLTVSHWGSSYVELRGLLPGICFAVCVVAWGIFTLQDGVLTGLRNAVWVPLENGLFGIVKIVLLLALAAALPAVGIEISWMLPVIVSLPLINLLIFGKLMPRHVLLTGDRHPPNVRQIVHFLAGDYVGALCLLATTNLVPIAVAVAVGPGMNAYFYMAWTVGGVLDLLAINMAMSLTVEGAFDSATLAANCRAALRRMMVLLVPVAFTVALLAPIALGFFGPHYATYGAPILILLSLATLPKALTELYLGALRAQSRTRLIAVIQVARAVLLLGLALALTRTMGLVGAGVAALASQSAIALVIAPALRRVLVAGRATALPADVEGENILSVQEQELAADPGVTLPEPRRRLPAWLPAAALTALSAAGLAVFMSSLGSVTARLGQMTGLGLISVLPPRALAGVLLIAVAFVLALGLSRPWHAMLGGMLIAIVVCLDGVTAIAEPDPRFPTAYWIAGFVDYVSRTGHTAPGLSAYFSWPGFFDLVALVEHGTGIHNLMPVLRFWPLGVDLACLIPLTMILLRLRASWRARWFAALAFSVGNWVGQDYFSPQSFNFLLYLLFIALLLTWFGRSGAVRPREAPPATAGPVQPVGNDTDAFAMVRRLDGPGRPAVSGPALPQLSDEPTMQMEQVRWDAPSRLGRLGWRMPGYVYRARRWLGRAWLTSSPQEPDGYLWWAPRWVRSLIRPFRGRLYRRPPGHRPRWKTLVTRPVPGDLQSKPATRAQRATMLALLIGIGTFSTVSHQLTPFFMLAACAGLILARRCRLPGLPVLLAVLFAGWLSFGAVDYWSGHISSIFGGLGNLGSNVSTSVSGRMVGSTPLHVLVLYSRTAFAGAALVLAAAGLWRRRRLGIDDRVALALLCVPFVGFGMQSYGGEIALRVYMFALPGIAILTAFLFFPNPAAGRRVWRAVPAAAVCMVAAVALFFVARYGNEAFEQTPPGEVAAMNYLYAHDNQGIRVAWLSEAPALDDTPQMPWQYQDIEKINYIPEAAPADPGNVSGLAGDLRALGPGSYLITTSTQETYLEQAASYQAGWGRSFRADMAAAPAVKVVFSSPTAVIYTLRDAPDTPRQAMPATAAAPTRATIWTPIGLAVLVLLLMVLIGREFARVWLPNPRRLVRRLTVTSLPLLVLFVVIVILRFLVLA